MKKLLYLSLCFFSLNMYGSDISEKSEPKTVRKELSLENTTQDRLGRLQEVCLDRRALIESGTLQSDSLRNHLETLRKKETEILYLRNKEIVKQGQASQELQGLFGNQRHAVKNIRRLKELLADPGLLSDDINRYEDQKADAYDQAYRWGLLFYNRSQATQS